jgi:purine-cytosine permease-like protein
MPTASVDSANKLLLLVAMNVAASVAHYADNIVRFVSYPEPPWLSPERVDVFWFFMTPFGLAACWLYRRGRARAAFFASYSYAAMNLLVLGHYLVAPPWRLPLLINLLIVLEAVTATLLLVFTVGAEYRAAHRVTSSSAV